MAATFLSVRTGNARLDRTSERATSINQLLFGLAVIVSATSLMYDSVAASPDALMAGVLLTFAVTVVALIVRWNRLPSLFVLVVPLGDMIAVLLLQLGEPMRGLWLLWLAPTVWLATLGGLGGLVAGTAGTTLMFWFAAFHGAGPVVRTLLLVGPVAMATAAVVAFTTARRAAAQRSLLDEEAAYLDHAVERARRQEDAVSEVLDAVDFGVVRISSDGSMLIENEAHARLTTADETEMQFDADGVTPTSPGMQPAERARRGESFEGVLTWRGSPGEPRRALQSTARRLRDANGLDVGGILVTRDVTVEQNAMRMRDELVASVSHELRTPLTSVLGHLDLAIDDPSLTPDVRRSLEIAERNASRLLVIINDILAATAGGAGRLDVNPTMDDVSRVVIASAEAMEPRARARGIRIETSGVESVTAEIDAHRIRQVIDNLVGNAVKYHTGDGLVEIDVTSDDRDVYIMVRDDGPGIAESELPRLFERYYQAGDRDGARSMGSGLGLAISRDLVRAHGGEIIAQSDPGEGSTFVVRLPRRRTDRAQR